MADVTERLLADRYRLGPLIARGGMGAVHRARDTRLERDVAVKLLGDVHSDMDVAVERFRREARAAARLSHPNIASVFDYGEDNDDYFIVMELLPGTTLADALKEEGALAPDRAARIALQVAEALIHAHDHSLVHRDVKPGNVLFAGEDRIKVTDFGIARLDGQTRLTSTGGLFGTPQYISPEQMDGKHATACSDIYAVGVMLYEMLTGRAPFDGDNAIAVAMRHLSEDIPSPRSHDPNLPEKLDAIVLKATQRDPDKRYQDARGLADALIDHLQIGEMRTTESLGTDTTVAVQGTRPLPTERTTPTTRPLTEEVSVTLRRAVSSVPPRLIWAVVGILLLLVIVVAVANRGDAPTEERRPGNVEIDLDDALDRLEEVVRP